MDRRILSFLYLCFGRAARATGECCSVAVAWRLQGAKAVQRQAMADDEKINFVAILAEREQMRKQQKLVARDRQIAQHGQVPRLRPATAPSTSAMRSATGCISSRKAFFVSSGASDTPTTSRAEAEYAARERSSLWPTCK